MDRQNLPPHDPIEKLAWYMDEAFRIPGTRFRVGWDAILGLIPGLGETVMVLVQSALVAAAVSRDSVPPIIAVRMVLNVLLDSLVGSIPIVGDIFDAFFKANTRNIRLLRQVRAQRSVGQPVSRGRHYAYVFTFLALLLLTVVGCLALIFFMVSSLWKGIQAPEFMGGWA